MSEAAAEIVVEEEEEEEEVETPPSGSKAAPIPELLPVIREGHWVRLARARGVPASAVGRDAQVVRAPVKRTGGEDTMSPGPYEYQVGDEVFLVRLRDTSEELEVRRNAFAAFDTDRVRLGIS